MPPTLQRTPFRLPSPAILLALLAVAIASTGCQTPAKEAFPLIVFPQPPAKVRIQYMGSFSSPQDLPRKSSKFADFVLGEEPVTYPIAKPIAAEMVDDRVYICDTVFNSVLVYDLATGQARPFAGDRDIGDIKQPNNIHVGPDGRFFVADKERQAVLVYDAEESFLAAWGRPGEAAPVDVAVRGDDLFVCDISNHRVEVWSATDGSLKEGRTVGGLGTGEGQFLFPTFIALDDAGNLYVTDTGNCRIQKFSPEGEFLMMFGTRGMTFGQFQWPKGVDVDGRGRIYVADSRFCNVQVFNPEGKLLLPFGGPLPQRGNLDLPAGLCVKPWREIPWLRERLMPGFEPEFLVVAISQKGQGFVNLFAVARDEEAM